MFFCEVNFQGTRVDGDLQRRKDYIGVRVCTWWIYIFMEGDLDSLSFYSISAWCYSDLYSFFVLFLSLGWNG